MSYTGVAVPIPMGQGGLHTDDSPLTIPPTDLIVANNVSVQNNFIEKLPGAVKFNLTAITSGVYGMYDFWPTTSISDRRLIVLGGDGKTYAIDNSGAVTEITPAGGAPATLTVTNQVYFVTGGNEAVTNNKKLFIFTGSNPVQVISGTGITRTNIAAPPADWSGGNQPSFGIIYNNRMFAGGNLNNPHAVYVSLASNHENFTGTPLTYFVYPGEGRNLVNAIIYKGQLFVGKYPFGAYWLNDPNADPTTWFFVKTENSFGFATSHSTIPVLNDVLIKNSSDGITSIVATRDFGDIQAADMTTLLRIDDFMKENTNPDGNPYTHAIYYPAKKLAMFTYRSNGSLINDRILMFRVDISGKPKATFINCLEPNCLSLRQDTSFVERPIMGSLDGYVYILDQENRNIANTAYTGEFQLPHMDFGFIDSKYATINKNFDFLELKYVPQGDWNIYADIIIDGNLYETITFPMTGDALLADASPQANDFMLSETSSDPQGSPLSGEDIQSLRKRISGTGRTLSIKIYNSGLNQTFKIATMIVSFEPSSEQQR